MSGPDEPVHRQVSATLSSGALAAEYRTVVSALRRCEPVLHRFDPTPYPAGVIAAARIWWGKMMRTEYESSSVFVDLALQMRQIDSPFDVQSAVLRMAHEELRHAELCAGVLESLGTEATIPAPPVLRLATHPGCPIEETVLRNVIYCCCLGETINAARLAKRIGETSDPFMRETFRQLAADERFHAQFGYLYLETTREWLTARPDVRRSLARYLRYAFAVLEQHMGGNPADARRPTDAERAIGLPDLTDVSATFQETILNACVPGLERFGIAAGSAWFNRTASEEPGTSHFL
ncbi:MAG: ferritin-like domain-containing protein [Verrucomicrobiota bacterium]